MDTIKIFFNGKEIDVNPRQTILEIAASQGVEIPALCYDPQLVPFGSCFLCVVEIEGMKSFKPACSTKPTPGMKVKTSSEKIKKARKMALELLLSNHYADCLAPCTLTCPARVDVQGYIALIANKKYKEATALIKETNPFPLSIGRVCTRPCEGKCRRGIFEEPVAIDYLKRFAADYDLNSGSPWRPKIKNSRDEKIAVIGSGPGGLTAAYYLTIEGYKTTVFEKLPKAGGMLRYGIPEYRLPKNILDNEIAMMEKIGVNIKTGMEFGKDISLDDLKKQGYKAFIFAPGAQKGMSMRVKGENLPNVYVGVDFLREIALGEEVEIGKTVAVIGGGNTAMDAARTALRLGAENVKIIYRRTRDEMPANEMEVEEALEEGIDFVYLTAPVEVLPNEAGMATAIKCVKMELGEPDQSGRRRPIPIEGSEYEIPVNQVIAAIGQRADLDFLTEEPVDLEITKWNTFNVQEETMSCQIQGFFALGDAVTGPAAAIDAIAGGGKAARAVHSFLQYGEIRSSKKEFYIRKDDFKELTPDDFKNEKPTKREKMATQEPNKRIRDFREVELGYTEEQALKEAERCLECGCKDVFECSLKKFAAEYEADVSNFIGKHKNIPNDNSHPYINIEPNKCVNCGRCVRTCEEVQKTYAWGFVKRGFDAIIQPEFEDPLILTNCENCGQCVQACPVGALTEKNPSFRKPGPFKEKTFQHICHYCSVGCSLNIHHYSGEITRVTASEPGNTFNRGKLCANGRFGYEHLNGKERLIKPLLKKNGEHVEISWKEAKKIIRDKWDKTEEKAIALGESLPTDCYSILNSSQTPIFSWAQIKYQNMINTFKNMGLLSYLLDKSPFHPNHVFLINTNFQEQNPVLLLRIMEDIKSGLSVTYIGPKIEPKLKEFISQGTVTWIKIESSEVFKWFEGLNAFYKEANHLKFPIDFQANLDNKKIYQDFITSFNQSPHFAFLFNELSHEETFQLSYFTEMNLKDPGELKLLYIGERCNSAGWLYSRQYELTPPPTTSPQLIVTLRQDPIGTIGNDEVINYYKNSSFSITADVTLTETAKKSDLIIPIKGFGEYSGSFINFLGKTQFFVSSDELNNESVSPLEFIQLLFPHDPEKLDSDFFIHEQKKILETTAPASHKQIIAYGGDGVEKLTKESYLFKGTKSHE